MKDGKWHVDREWYLDPLDRDLHLIPAHLFPYMKTNIVNNTPAFLVQSNKWKVRRSYNREQAVAYADKYAGAAFFAGNNHRYNPKYIDYTYIGGDCTNFTSQVLGDPDEGGGLPMVGAWNYRYKQGGTVVWVRTDAFKNFLLKSGYGKMIAKGTYDLVAKPTKKFPQKTIAELKPGDLIAYEEHGKLDYFAVVTARDERGYPLVNSHTADRYHVPWDLGWDKNAKFLLIRIID